MATNRVLAACDDLDCVERDGGGRHVCTTIDSCDSLCHWRELYSRWDIHVPDTPDGFSNPCTLAGGGLGEWCWYQAWSPECYDASVGHGCCLGEGDGNQYAFNATVRAFDTGEGISTGHFWGPSSMGTCSAPLGVEVECPDDICGATQWMADCHHADIWTTGPGSINVNLTPSSAHGYNHCNWYVQNYATGLTGESGGSCTASFNVAGRFDKGVHFLQQRCAPKTCSFNSVSDADFSDGISDVWCTYNNFEGCQYTYSGVYTVNGQNNPGFWHGSICGANQNSYLWGEKIVNVDDVSKYVARARAGVDDTQRIFIERVGNPDAYIDAMDFVSRDACTGIPAPGEVSSNCGVPYNATYSWVNYTVNFPANDEYIMNIHLKHDQGCTDNGELTYLFDFDSEIYEHIARKQDNSWEWVSFYIGQRSGGNHSFRFALKHDCIQADGSQDLNAHISNTTINGINVPAITFVRDINSLRRTSCCGWMPAGATDDPSTWADITSSFQTGWNIIRFLANDTCSGGRYFNFDLDVSEATGDCGICIPSHCATIVAKEKSPQHFALAENKVLGARTENDPIKNNFKQEETSSFGLFAPVFSWAKNLTASLAETFNLLK